MIGIRLDTVDIARLANALKAVGTKGPGVIARAINRAGDQATTAMVRTLTTQTGLKRKVIVTALRKTKASGKGDLAYTIASRGGDIRLKYFSPRETRRGVSANPRGKRQLFAGSFLRAGRFPNRKTITNRLTGGQVYERQGGGKWPVKTVRSGVIIPAEMVQGATEAAFYEVTRRVLPARLEHELYRILPR